MIYMKNWIIFEVHSPWAFDRLIYKHGVLKNPIIIIISNRFNNEIIVKVIPFSLRIIFSCDKSTWFFFPRGIVCKHESSMYTNNMVDALVIICLIFIPFFVYSQASLFRFIFFYYNGKHVCIGRIVPDRSITTFAECWMRY